jgi:hypothetical protein
LPTAVDRLLGALGFGIEQDPDFASERIQPDPGIALGKGRKVYFAKVKGFLQSRAEGVLNGTGLASHVYLDRKVGKMRITPYKRRTLPPPD